MSPFTQRSELRFFLLQVLINARHASEVCSGHQKMCLLLYRPSVSQRL